MGRGTQGSLRGGRICACFVAKENVGGVVGKAARNPQRSTRGDNLRKTRKNLFKEKKKSSTAMCWQRWRGEFCGGPASEGVVRRSGGGYFSSLLKGKKNGLDQGNKKEEGKAGNPPGKKESLEGLLRPKKKTTFSRSIQLRTPFDGEKVDAMICLGCPMQGASWGRRGRRGRVKEERGGRKGPSNSNLIWEGVNLLLL